VLPLIIITGALVVCGEIKVKLFCREWANRVLDADAEASVKFRVWNYPIKEQYTVMMIKINDTGKFTTFKEGIDRVSSSINCS
jgi:hypothetical protein